MVDALIEKVEGTGRFVRYGRVTRVVGLVIEATGLTIGVGELCRIQSLTGDHTLLAEVAGFHERGVLLLPLGEIGGVHPGSAVEPLGRSFGVDVGPGLLGRVVDGLGRPIDGKRDIGPTTRMPLSAEPPSPLERQEITEPLTTGVRALDGITTMRAASGLGSSPAAAWARARSSA